MAVYDFERCSVYLVEDNVYIRKVVESLLHGIKFGRVSSAPDGAEAIDYFKTLHAGGGYGGGPTFDIVISDLLMAPINGLLFLRWLRTAKESPNRFIPFIMLSGAADASYVNAARDLGVTEFLSKPFSVTSVYKKILEAVDYPRQFVATQSYFGPDRRRKDKSPPGEDRRKLKSDDITIVYSADKVVKPKDGSDVWYFRLSNHLKEKVGGMGSSGPGELPIALLQEAEEELERSALDFTDWAADYLAKLSKLCDKALEKEGTRSAEFEEINLLAHELRGQGGTFGYPLITVFGKMLFDVTGGGCVQNDSAVEIVKAHIDAMRAVIREKVAGDGGQVGRELLKSLEVAIERQTAVS